MKLKNLPIIEIEDWAPLSAWLSIFFNRPHRFADKSNSLLVIILQEESGATLLVSAKFSIISARNIYLEFEEVSTSRFCNCYFVAFFLALGFVGEFGYSSMVSKLHWKIIMSEPHWIWNLMSWMVWYGWQINVQNIKISEELQAVIAPALLPRSFISLQVKVISVAKKFTEVRWTFIELLLIKGKLFFLFSFRYCNSFVPSKLKFQ